MKTCSVSVIIGCLLIGFSGSAGAQAPQQSAQSSANVVMSSGVVVSATRGALLIRTDSGTYELYTFTPTSTRPPQLAAGATVAITANKTSATDQAPTVVLVRVTSPAPAKGAAPAPNAAPASDPVPESVRKMESTLTREARKFHVGVVGGAALAPELVMIGGNGQFGPFFGENVMFRPGLTFGFGEVTTLIAIDLDVMFRLPVTQQDARWITYAGAGPALTFAHLGLPNEVTSQDNNISFSQLEFDGGLNVFLGLLSKKGMSLELKATVYSEPTLRLLVGYEF